METGRENRNLFVKFEPLNVREVRVTELDPVREQRVEVTWFDLEVNSVLGARHAINTPLSKVEIGLVDTLRQVRREGHLGHVPILEHLIEQAVTSREVILWLDTAHKCPSLRQPQDSIDDCRGQPVLISDVEPGEGSHAVFTGDHANLVDYLSTLQVDYRAEYPILDNA